MKALILVLLSACSPYEALCSRSDNCGQDLDREISGFAIRDGDKLTLLNGRKITVRVLFGALIQRFSEDTAVTDGVCGFWNPEENTITLSVNHRCGSIEATLLHELGHANGLQHGDGIMASGYAGPVTKEESVELFAKVLR